MMGLNPFAAYGHHPFMGMPPRHQPIRTPPRRSPAPTPYALATAAVEPHVKLSETSDHYRADVTAPDGFELGNVRASREDVATLVVQGMIAKENRGLHQYATRRRAGVYSAPDEEALVGVVPAGTRVEGGAPTRSGWIALDDDEMWMIDDGALALVGRPEPSRPRAFAKRLSLPADAEVHHARAEDREDGGLSIIVPRMHRQAPAARQVPVNVKRTPPPQPAPAARVNKKPTAAAAAPAAPAPTMSAAAPKPAAAVASTKDMNAEEYKQAHKQRAASRRRDFAAELAELHGIAYEGPVLEECQASSRNVQSPTESVEEWVATADGGFTPGRARAAMNGVSLSKTDVESAQQAADDEDEELSYWGF